eukprot:scaffold8850_cov134-Isochrysis_galbana.AAC.15
MAWRMDDQPLEQTKGFRCGPQRVYYTARLTHTLPIAFTFPFRVVGVLINHLARRVVHASSPCPWALHGRRAGGSSVDRRRAPRGGQGAARGRRRRHGRHLCRLRGGARARPLARHNRQVCTVRHRGCGSGRVHRRGGHAPRFRLLRLHLSHLEVGAGKLKPAAQRGNLGGCTGGRAAPHRLKRAQQRCGFELRLAEGVGRAIGCARLRCSAIGTWRCGGGFKCTTGRAEPTHTTAARRGLASAHPLRRAYPLRRGLGALGLGKRAQRIACESVRQLDVGSDLKHLAVLPADER